MWSRSITVHLGLDNIYRCITQLSCLGARLVIAVELSERMVHMQELTQVCVGHGSECSTPQFVCSTWHQHWMSLCLLNGFHVDDVWMTIQVDAVPFIKLFHFDKWKRNCRSRHWLTKSQTYWKSMLAYEWAWYFLIPQRRTIPWGTYLLLMGKLKPHTF